MLVPLTPFLWSTVQITVLTTVVLTISWLLRGRYPQWTSAMLAGSSLTVLVLATVVWFPISHWSLTSFPSFSIAFGIHSGADPSNIKATDGSRDTEASNANTSSQSSRKRSTIDREAPSQSAIEQLEAWVAGSSRWLKLNVQSIETRFRSIEEASTNKPTSIGSVQIIAGVIVLLLAGLWLHSWLWICSIVRSSQVIVDEPLRERLQQLGSSIRINRLPAILVSQQVAIGATVGVWRKRLILNPQWRDWSDNELDAVLLHELAHMLRHDFAWVVIGGWIRVILFYHPLVHSLVRRLRMEQELAADQLAASVIGNARAYGRALAKLALRAECVAKVPSPVLTAEQFCIVRRITMLKQGSLRPMKKGWRWSSAVIALTLACTAPLSGLRGTPPEEKPIATTTQIAPPTNDAAQLPETPEEIEKLMHEPRIKSNDEVALIGVERDLTQKEFPPLTFTGRVVWKPGQLATASTPASLRYIQDLVAFTFFELFPGKAEVNAPATMTMSWATRARDRGLLTFGATCNEVQGMDPNSVLRLITNPLLTNYSLSDEKKRIGGKEATRLIAKGTNPETRKAVDESDPSMWIVGNETDFHFGTEEQILERLERKESSRENLPQTEAFHELTNVAATSGFVLEFDDCDTWVERLRDHFHGTSKEVSVALAYPFLQDLKSIRVSLDSSNSPDPGGLPLGISLTFQNETAARDGMDAVHSLISLAKVSSFEKENVAFIREFLNRMEVFSFENTVLVQCASSKAADVLCEMVLPEKLFGWTDILALVEPAETPGTVTFECSHGFGSTGFLAQSIESRNYRGKRVRVSAQISATDEVHSRCGTIVWGSDSQYCTIGNATSGKSIGAPIDPRKAFQMLTEPANSDSVSWRTKTVEWNVPADTDVLSFGIYLAAGTTQVRNIKFEVVGSATNSKPDTQLAALPRNLLHIPVRKPLAAPTNLDFSQQVAPSSTSSEAVQTATKVEVDVKR